MNPCKHLDHDTAKYPSCKLITLHDFRVEVKYWQRKLVGGGSQNVQFCGQGRGRINGIFQCYNQGEMSCYEPSEVVNP